MCQRAPWSHSNAGGKWQIDLIHIYRKLQPTTAEHIFVSSTNGTFSKTGHRLGHKINLSKCQKTEILQRMFSDHMELS